jgi:hypothetical protein
LLLLSLVEFRTRVSKQNLTPFEWRHLWLRQVLVLGRGQVLGQVLVWE